MLLTSEDRIIERRFEVVSAYQDRNIQLPTRKTRASAGYDICAAETVTVEPGKVALIPTGLKAKFPEDEVLLLSLRSSVGIKRGLLMPNAPAVIDADYYNNPDNEGHIHIAVLNYTDKPVTINAGERIAQGIFVEYWTVDNDKVDAVRTGGFGSTGV